MKIVNVDIKEDKVQIELTGSEICDILERLVIIKDNPEFSKNEFDFFIKCLKVLEE